MHACARDAPPPPPPPALPHPPAQQRPPFPPCCASSPPNLPPPCYPQVIIQGSAGGNPWGGGGGGLVSLNLGFEVVKALMGAQLSQEEMLKVTDERERCDDVTDRGFIAAIAGAGRIPA